MQINTFGSDALFKVNAYYERLHDRQALVLGFWCGGCAGIFFPNRTLPVTLLGTSIAWFLLRPKINEKLDNLLSKSTHPNALIYPKG